MAPSSECVAGGTALDRVFAGAIEAVPEAMLGASGRLLEIPGELRELARSVFRMRGFGGPPVARETRSSSDTLGHEVYEIDGLNRPRRRSYDATGNEIAYLDRDGKLYRQETTSWNLLGAKIDPLGNAVRYTYDSIEQIVGLSDPLGNESRWVYDQSQRLTAVCRHGRVRDNYDYDEHDHFVAKRDGDGALIFENLEWHDNHLVKRRVLASGGEHHYDYDSRGRITRAGTEAHDVRLRHGFLGWRSADLRDGEGLVRSGFEGSERVRLFDKFEWRCEQADDGTIKLTAPNGAVSELRHGGDGVVLRECSSGTREWLQYDHEGRLEGRMTARRGTHGEHVGWGARYGYSGEGDLLSVADSARGTTLYEVDDAHRLIGMTPAGGERVAYEFDAASNLIHSGSTSRLSVRAGNRADATATEMFEHDGRDRVCVRVTGTGR